MNIVGCDDLGALFLTIVTCVTVGATSVRPQRDRSLRKERPRIRLTIAWEAFSVPDTVQPVFGEDSVRVPILMYHSILRDSARQGKYVISPAVWRPI